MFLPLSPPVTTKPESGSAENFFKCDPLSLLSPSSKRVLSPIQPSSLDDQHISTLNNSQPSRILPFLFLGGSKDAKNSGYLRTQNVQYIVNCGHETLNHNDRQREQTVCQDSSSENHRCYHHLDSSGTAKTTLHHNELNLISSYNASWSKSGKTYHQKCQNFTHENDDDCSEELDENAVIISAQDSLNCDSVFTRQISLPVARKEFKNRTTDGNNVLNIAAFDSPQQDLKQYFVQVIKFIEKARASNSSILVHCSAGISRSATLVVAYVMWYFQLSFMAAYKFVQNLRPQISPNLNFVGQLVEFATELTKDDSDILSQLGFSNCKTNNSSSNITQEISTLSVPKRKRSVSENVPNSKEAKSKKQVKNAINSCQG